MSKKKEIKIKRSKKIKTKKTNVSAKPKKVFGTIVFITIVAAVGFFGYSIVAPVLDYIVNPKNTKPDEYPLPAITTSAGENPITSAVTTTTNPSAQTINEGIYLPETALSSTIDLNKALDNIKDAENVIIPLKLKGGALNYLTDNELAVSAKSVSGELKLEEIFSAVKAKGFTPVADVNLLEDNLYPSTYGDTAYLLPSGSRWLDNAPTAGGKPWLSPYATGTKTYLISILTEINDAGFEDFVFSGVCFAPFRNSDLTKIVDPVKDTDSYIVLGDLVEDCIQSINGGGSDNKCRFALKINSNDILNSAAPILNFDFSLLDTEKISYFVEFDTPSKKIIEDYAELSDIQKYNAITIKINEVYPKLEYIPIAVNKNFMNENGIIINNVE